MLRWLAALLVVLLSWSAPAAAAPDCDSPRAAADSIFGVRDLPPGTAGPLACVEVPAGADERQRIVQLVEVLDARGLYVPVDSLPRDPAHLNADGEAVVQPMPTQAPWLLLSRGVDGQWRYSASTIRQIPDLYASTFSALSLWFQSTVPGGEYPVPFLGLYVWQLALALALLLLAIGAGWLAQVPVLGWGRALVRRLGLTVADEVLRKADRPLLILVAASVLLWRMPDLQLSIDISRTLGVALSVMVGLAGIMVASRIIDIVAGIFAVRAEATENRLDDQIIPLLRQAGQIVVWIIGILFVLQNNGVQVWSFVAGLGIGSLAFALAAQDSIENLFGALNIFLDSPFEVGDWVVIGEVEGVVEEVGFRSFRVRTFYNSVVTIPNSAITQTNVDNWGRRHRRRVRITLGLTYDTPPDTLQAYVEGVRAILANHPKVQKTYEVHFYNFGDSALEILVYYHLLVDSYTEELEARAQNFLEFLRLAEEMGVSFAFPSTSLYIESTPEQPLPDAPRPGLSELTERFAAFGPDGAKARPGGPTFDRSFAATAVTAKGGE